jgi:hypothetical protein
VKAWCDLDRSRAAWPSDHEVIGASASIRALVIERARARATDPTEDELFDACAILGRRIAEARGSVTLAAWTADHAGEALGVAAAEWVRPAGAAVAEGYVAETLDAAHRAAQDAWEFPRCVVSVGPNAVAIAAGYPSDDTEAVAEWAARVTRAAAVRGVRKAFVAGPHTGAIVEALLLAGIEPVAT